MKSNLPKMPKPKIQGVRIESIFIDEAHEITDEQRQRLREAWASFSKNNKPEKEDQP